MNSVKDAITELERIYAALIPLFDKDMPQPVITIQSKGRKRCVAWFAGKKWQNNEIEPIGEINFCAESLSRPDLDIGATMAHEMSHYANWLDDIKDCTVNQYHNENFKLRAESVGLICEKTRSGWATTKAGADLMDRIYTLKINTDAFGLYRLSPEAKPTKKNNLRKYTCGCSNCWAKTIISAVCSQCNRAFVG
jgi:hypothetical protein